jgi:transcriptional regulator with XRE-family HTH domain
VERTRQGLREARVAVGLSQAGLAGLLVVSTATVSRWESGLRRPPHDLLEPMAVALGVSVGLAGSWFTQVRWLKGDGVGRVPGLKYLLRDRGVGIEVAARVCGVSVEQMRAWVFDGRTLQRAAVEPLAGLLGMSPQEFVHAARLSSGRDADRGSVLRGVRRARQLTQDELGRRIGVAGETISHWERGTWTPPVHQVFRLARVLGVDAMELGRGVGVAMPDPAESQRATSAGAGGRLQDARLRAGLTRAQLARCIGVRSSTVGGWEAGRSRPRGRYRERLQSVLGVGALEPLARYLPGPAEAGESSPRWEAEQAGGRRCA